jgi:hypothetical protein
MLTTQPLIQFLLRASKMRFEPHVWTCGSLMQLTCFSFNNVPFLILCKPCVRILRVFLQCFFLYASLIPHMFLREACIWKVNELVSACTLLISAKCPVTINLMLISERLSGTV